MSKEIYISSTPHETRLAIVESDELTEIYYERENEYTLAGSIYNGKVTRVLPGMQSSFVDIGLERDAFLYITDFMEEAADTAEFDHSGDAPRPARLEGGRGEGRGERSNGGRDRDYSRGNELGNGRSEGYVSEREREQISATPASDAARASEGRSEDFGGRNERNGRGRGRRDRGGSGDRNGSGERVRSSGSRFGQSSGTVEGGASDFEIEERPLVAATGMVEPEASSAGDGVELGEGAPGADGSRRWRGRRGRRRGRGTGPREGVAGAEAGAIPPVEGGDEFDEASSFEIDGSMTAEPAVAAPVAPAATIPVRREILPVGQGRDGRGDRGRDGRGERGQGAPRVPRGFAPRRSFYGVDSSPEMDEMVSGEVVESMAAGGVEPEPLILPGESLSKYRKGGEEIRATSEAGSGPAAPIAATDSGYKVDPSWDGGAMLPGETLSRYRGGASHGSASSSRTDARADFKRPDGRPDGRRDGRQRNGGRGGRDGDSGSRPARFDRGEEPMMVPSFVPAADLQSGGPVSGYAHVDQQVEEIRAHQADFADAELPEATAEAAQMEDKGLAHQEGSSHHGVIDQIDAAQDSAEVNTTEEYEPEGESVSYRVDPVAPSEYRQHAGVAAAEETAEVIVSEQAGGLDQPDLAGSADGPGLSVPSAGPTALEASDHEDAVSAHEVTTIDSAGEMHSEVSLHPLGLEEVDAPQGFSPGVGDLEEDFIEEEELEIASLHAHGDEEFDDLEEEHLDGAADLGMMIRDMTVDQITRADSGSSEDEDDFEEDTLEDEGESSDAMPEGLDVPESFASPQDGGFGEEASSRTISSRPSGVSERRGRGDNGQRRSSRDRSGNRSSGRGSEERGSWPDRSGLGERARNTGGSGDRDRGRSSGRGGRQSAQMTNLPAISDLLKPGQEILCQIAKEPIAKKGARITSHIALPGRFLVFMPTVSHAGVSRKIESDGERRRLKEILLSEKGEAAGGFIVRTAAAGASEEELRSDLRFLLNLWSDIKQRSESSKSPALIYHDLNLVERILRDQVTDNFSAIWVDTETEYERVLRFLQRFQPGLIRRVKLYTKETPLFEQFGITEEINKALRSKVWLKSGGSIVINQTEALVAIDINTGKYVGKTARLEDTIVKTNLDAIPEIVRQIRLRDLGGIIIIDFIDMDERKNRNRVMQALEDELKNDRAPSKVLPFNDFGLVAITRKRVKQSLERTLSTPCTVCVGTGMVKSPVTVCNDIYVEMRKMHKHLDRGDVMLRVHPEVVKQLKSTGTRWLQEMEEMCGKTILIKSDPSLHPEQFDIH